MGKETVVGDRRPPPEPAAPGTAGREHDGLPGPDVKASSCCPAHPSEKQALRDAWADFLVPIPFQWFATLTFETNVHPEAALKRYRRFTNQINRELYGRRWAKRFPGGIYWIVAIERQRRGVVHLHALLGDINDLNAKTRRLYWMDYWDTLAGFARIEEIRNEEATLRYVTKYVVKDGEIEFSGNLGEFVRRSDELLFAK